MARLKLLNIKDFALIKDINIEFSQGLNILTGETGAGKSIIIEALGLLLGKRSSQQNIRNGAQRCIITGIFDCSDLPELNRLLDESGIKSNSDDELVIRREIDINTKNRVYVNDIPINISLLQRIGEYLIEFHGQYDNQMLLKSYSQRDILDAFCGLMPLRLKIKELFERWQELKKQQEKERLTEEERNRLLDLYRFQIKEIEEANIVIDEEEEIEKLLPQYKNAEKLAQILDQTHEMLYSEDGSILEKLSKIQRLFDSIKNYGIAFDNIQNTLSNVYLQLEDISQEIFRFRQNLPSDPTKLNELLSRQELLNRLKNKYGKSLRDVISYYERIKQEIDLLDKSEERNKELENKIKRIYLELEKYSNDLSLKRKKGAEKLTLAVEKELKDLGMKKARFNIGIEKLPEITSDGQEKIDFLFTANPGQNLGLLREIASGGEMSRVMLAIKTVLARTDKIPILIFDEIDQGIGGPIGQVIGIKLKQLSKHHQILCITHLAQIAAFADLHISVLKETKGQTTFTDVSVLSELNRVEELARMLSGLEVTSTARKHAYELIETASKYNI